MSTIKDLTIPIYFDINAQELNQQTAITGINESMRANLDFQINLPMPVNLFNSIYTTKQRFGNTTVIPYTPSIQAVNSFINNYYFHSVSGFNSFTSISEYIVHFEDLINTPALFTTCKGKVDYVDITTNKRSEYSDVPNQSIQSFINDLISSKIIYSLRTQLADKDGFGLGIYDNSGLTISDIDSMIFQTNQDIQFNISEYITNFAQSIFFTAFSQDRTSTINGSLKKLNFQIGDTLTIPLRINLHNQGKGLASIQLGSVSDEDIHNFGFDIQNKLSNHSILYNPNINPGISSRLHLYSDHN